MVQRPQASLRHVWIRRAAYLAVAIAAFVGLPLILIIIADLTGVVNFSQIFGDLVFWNELSGPSFVIAFFTIIIFVGFIVYLLLNVFETSEGAW
jgi:hypothetical protein